MEKQKTQIKPPSRFWLLIQPLALVELFVLAISLPYLLLRYQKGSEPVLIIPGFLVGDFYMWPMKMILRAKGHDAHGWGLGMNKKYKKSIQEKIEEKIEEIFEKNGGRKVVLVGFSLGGIYARFASFSKREQVKKVITLGTPFAEIKKSFNVRKLYRLVSGKSIEEEVPEERLKQIRKDLPVPNISIYSYFDGMVSLEACIEPEDYNTQNKEVTSTHMGLPFSVSAIGIILDSLKRNK